MGEANLIAERARSDELTTEELLEVTDTIAETSDEMVRMSEKVRTIQRRIHSEPDSEEAADLVTLARVVVQQYRADNSEVEITFDAPEEAKAIVSNSYEIALSELIENAIAHHEGSATRASRYR